jgi:hypothetical protein
MVQPAADEPQISNDSFVQFRIGSLLAYFIFRFVCGPQHVQLSEAMA